MHIYFRFGAYIVEFFLFYVLISQKPSNIFTSNLEYLFHIKMWTLFTWASIPLFNFDHFLDIEFLPMDKEVEKWIMLSYDTNINVFCWQHNFLWCTTDTNINLLFITGYWLITLVFLFTNVVQSVSGLAYILICAPVFWPMVS